MFGISHFFKPENPLLDRTVSYHQFLIGNNNPETRKRYEQTIEQGHFTLKELLQIKINPRLLFSTLLREKILPDDVLHKISVLFCKDFLNRLEDEGVPLNGQYLVILNTKDKWAQNKVRDLDLELAQREAHNIFSETNKTYTDYRDAASYAVYSATLMNATDSIRGVMNATSKVYDTENEYKRWQEILFKELTN